MYVFLDTMYILGNKFTTARVGDHRVLGDHWPTCVAAVVHETDRRCRGDSDIDFRRPRRDRAASREIHIIIVQVGLTSATAAVIVLSNDVNLDVGNNM